MLKTDHTIREDPHISLVLLEIITHRLISARSHWTKHILRYKIEGRLSGSNSRPIFFDEKNKEIKSQLWVLVVVIQ